MEEHRPVTSILHPTRSWTIVSTCSQLLLILFMCASNSVRSVFGVFFDLPLSHFPSRLQVVSACLVIDEYFINRNKGSRSAQASSSTPNGICQAFARTPQFGWTIGQGGGRVRTNRLREKPARRTATHPLHAQDQAALIIIAVGWPGSGLFDVLVIRTIGLIPRSTISTATTDSQLPGQYVNHYSQYIVCKPFTVTHRPLLLSSILIIINCHQHVIESHC